MGWYTALGHTGVLSIEDCARLVETMGQYQVDNVIGGQIAYPMVDRDWRISADTLAALQPVVDVRRKPNGSGVVLDRAYQRLPNPPHGVCREQARGVLPQNLYTEYYGTVNLNNLLKFINKEQTRLVFLSSVAVYGLDGREYPVTVEDKKRPASEYGLSKLKCEDVILDSGIEDFFILRPTPVFDDDHLDDIKKRVYF